MQRAMSSSRNHNFKEVATDWTRYMEASLDAGTEAYDQAVLTDVGMAEEAIKILRTGVKTARSMVKKRLLVRGVELAAP